MSADFIEPGSTTPEHILVGDLGWLEFAIADYIVRWGQHLPGVHPDTIAGTPTAVANMAMTVIRKNLRRAGSAPADRPTVDLEQDRYDSELHHRLRQLEDAVEVLWGELSIEQVRELRREMPELSDFLVHLHHGVSHEEAMVRRNVWAASLAEETPAEHAEADCPYADHGFCSAPYDRRLRAARSEAVMPSSIAATSHEASASCDAQEPKP